ncbi:MAG: hypothetical protein IT423_06145 [Pirellulaceae bacterium]|nr:hypothetical protein [Pirellulaceae bacterium]
MDEDLFTSVGASLFRGEVELAAKSAEDALRAQESTRFASLLTSGFTNTPSSVLDHINGFLMECKKAFDVKAIYLPHNGFTFNNDRWYFDANAYDIAKDIATDYEWLCHPRSIAWASFTLKGLEKAQEDFHWYVNAEKFEDEKWESIAAKAELLVKVRFVQLIASALASRSLALPVPIITTAYSCDFFCRFEP